MEHPSGADDRLRRIYADHGSVLIGYATRLCAGDRQRAEDIVQETLVRAWRHPEASDSGPHVDVTAIWNFERASA